LELEGPRLGLPKRRLAVGGDPARLTGLPKRRWESPSPNVPNPATGVLLGAGICYSWHLKKSNKKKSRNGRKD